MGTVKRICASAGAAILFAAGGHAAANEDAAAVVARLHSALVEVAADERVLSLDQRGELLAPVITETHDLAGMARLTVGRYWRGWTEEQQSAFLSIFEHLSITTYASRFSSVGADVFELVASEAVGADSAVVVALIHRPDDEAVEMNYDLRLSGDPERWRIVQVRPDGVSELSLMRSEYYEILGSGDYDDLVETLRFQIAAFYTE